MHDLCFGFLVLCTFFSSYQTPNPAIINHVHLGLRVLWHPESRKSALILFVLGLQPLLLTVIFLDQSDVINLIYHYMIKKQVLLFEKLEAANILVLGK